MSGSIVDFINALKTGVSSSARYKIRMSLPQGVTPDGKTLVYKDSIVGAIRQVENHVNHDGMIGMLASAVDMPGRTFETSVTKSHGPKAETPISLGDPEVCPITFIIDGDWEAYHYIETWANTVGNVPSGTLNYPDEFRSSVQINPLGRSGKELPGIILEKAWPKIVSPVSLSYQSRNSFAMVTVQFSYFKHYPTD